MLAPPTVPNNAARALDYWQGRIAADANGWEALPTATRNPASAFAHSADPPWPFVTFSDRAAGTVFDHYGTMSVEEIKALPVGQLAAPDCALLLWATHPNIKAEFDVIEASGFTYKTFGFVWLKTTANAEGIGLDGRGLHWGTGYHTHANTKPCLLATRGSPPRLSDDIVVAPVGEHSAKPEKVARRIERLYGAP
jgi:N6-adenosine-specific RNA methylase IME4